MTDYKKTLSEVLGVVLAIAALLTVAVVELNRPAVVQVEVVDPAPAPGPAPMLIPMLDTYPLVAKHVVIQAPGETWGLPTFTDELTMQLPDHQFTYGTCPSKPHPTVTCVTVIEDEWNEYQMALIDESYDGTMKSLEGGWYGLTSWENARNITIYLNSATRTTNKYPVVVHEMGHVLGLPHHEYDGVTGSSPDATHLSDVELYNLKEIND